MEQERRILNLLSLAKKAGRVASGEFSTEKAVKSGKAALVFVSGEVLDPGFAGAIRKALGMEDINQERR